MTGKRLFFLSLIVLSVAMGIHWIKHRPKPRPKRTQPRTALRLDDLQLQDEQSQDGDAKRPPGDLDPEAGFDPEADPEFIDPDENDSETDINDTGEQAQGIDDDPEQQPDTDAVASNTLGIDDPVIAAFQNLKRSPFQRSPYAILLDEIRAQRGMAQSDDVEVEAIPERQVRLLNANFSATIQTERELVAVINSSLYRKGEIFQSREITEIKDEYVSLETPEELLLIPKHGVNINIDERGNYTVADTFRQ